MENTGKSIAAGAIRELGLTEWYSEMHIKRLEAIAALANKNKKKDGEKILEVGVWPGYLAFCFFKMNFQVFGLELDPDRLPAGLPKEISISRCDLTFANHMEFPDVFFDQIVASEVLEHLKSERLPVILKEFFRLLTADGTLIISTPNRRSLGNFKKLFSKKTPGTDSSGHGHENEYSKNELEAAVFEAGFEINSSLLKNFYLLVGKESPDEYYFPIWNFFRRKRKVGNLLKILSIPAKIFPQLRDSIVIVAKKPRQD